MLTFSISRKKSLFFTTKQLEQFWGTLFGFHCKLAMKCGEFIHCSNGFLSIFKYSEKHLFCLYTTFSLCFKLTICALFSVMGLFSLSLFSFSCSFSLSFFCSIVYIHAHNHNVQSLFVELKRLHLQFERIMQSWDGLNCWTFFQVCSSDY